MFSELIKRHKMSIAFLGDIIIFFLSMIITLYGRYGNEDFLTQFSIHKQSFIVILILWITIFYISNLYTYKAFDNTIEIIKNYLITIFINFFITITIFYIFSRFFDLTPKANLVLFTTIFSILDLAWRYTLRRIFIQKKHHINILILASSPLVETVINHINKNPHLGYSSCFFNNTDSLEKIIKENSINLVIIDKQTIKNTETIKTLYNLISKNIEILTFTNFYEILFNCIPTSETEEEWFIREITKNKNIYELVKRSIEVVFSFIGIIIIIPLAIIISILIAITSRGPIIYKQYRVGKNNKPFVLYKFRTMKIDEDGPLWTTENDNRITTIGKILRYSHLDETPQLFNIIKGDISFIGPRPERIELVKIYEQIPYYEIRHNIKPGITGWAQLNYKPSTSLDEAEKKFQYDLYYLKNRSLILDLFILLKTIRMFFMTKK